MLAVALKGGHGDHVVEHRGNHILLPGRGEGSLDDLGVIQHIVDLVGQALTRQLDGVHVLPDVRGEALAQGHLADADDHVDGGAQLVGHVGQEAGVLSSRRLQLGKHVVIPLLLDAALLDPIDRQRRSAQGHRRPQRQPESLLKAELPGDGPQRQGMVQKQQDVEPHQRVQNPFFVQHEQSQNDDAGHGGYVKQAVLMDAEEKELQQHQPGTEGLIGAVGAYLSNVKQPHAETARPNQGNHPQLP